MFVTEFGTVPGGRMRLAVSTKGRRSGDITAADKRRHKIFPCV